MPYTGSKDHQLFVTDGCGHLFHSDCLARDLKKKKLKYQAPFFECPF
jgi:hypothetical protein